MVGQKKNKSINNFRKKTKSKKMVNNKKKSRKLAKSKKYEINNTNGNISGFIHQIQCTNNTCSEYKQPINSFDDLNKLFGLFKI